MYKERDIISATLLQQLLNIDYGCKRLAMQVLQRPSISKGNIGEMNTLTTNIYPQFYNAFVLMYLKLSMKIKMLILKLCQGTKAEIVTSCP